MQMSHNCRVVTISKKVQETRDLTSVICKLSETIIRDHMMDFLIKHKLINPSQRGFLKARSCLTNLLCFFEEITKWVDDLCNLFGFPKSI